MRWPSVPFADEGHVIRLFREFLQPLGAHLLWYAGGGSYDHAHAQWASVSCVVQRDAAGRTEQHGAGCAAAGVFRL